jgi:hypothetical protein
MIHIDSGTMLYHLKALTVEDYRAWTSVIKALKELEHRAIQESVHRLTHREIPAPKRVHLGSTWLSSDSQLDALKELMSTMDAGFSDIQDQLESIRSQSESTPSSQSSGKERQSSIDSKFKLPRFGIPRSMLLVLLPFFCCRVRFSSLYTNEKEKCVSYLRWLLHS